MYFKVGKEHFCYARCIRVVVAFACIQGFHGFHFFIGELEVEDVDVFFDSFLVGGFREDDESFLVSKRRMIWPGFFPYFQRGL